MALSQRDRKRVEKEIEIQINKAHSEANRILKTTFSFPNAVDSAHRAAAALARATSLREILYELDHHPEDD
jgi:AAA+ superfamily predicted ATPase